MFVGLESNIDGLIHLADISWKDKGADVISNYQKGQEVEVVVLNIDAEKERISLGIKQLEVDNFSLYISNNSKNSIVKGIVSSVDDKGAVIELSEGITAYLKVSEISEDRIESATSVLSIGDEVEVLITQIDRKTRHIVVSVKQKNKIENEENLKKYNSQEKINTSSATLGDILKGVQEK